MIDNRTARQRSKFWRFRSIAYIIGGAMIVAGGTRTAGAQITVRRIDGSVLTINKASLTEQTLRVQSEDDPADSSEIPREALISLDFGDAEAALPEGSLLEFANGDRLLVEIIEVRDDVLSGRVHDQDLDVPLGQLRGIVWNISAESRDGWPLLFREEGANDLVLLTNGDRSSGQFAGVNEMNVTLMLDGRTLAIPLERVAAIAFSPELIGVPENPPERQIVRTAAGWLTVTGLRGEVNGRFEGQTLFGADVSFASSDIGHIQFFGARVVSLTDLEPAAMEFTPWLTRQWPIRLHRSVADRPLELGGRIYATGIGVHSRTRLTYPLNGDYEWFSIVAGLAASAGARGNITLAIEVDGRAIARREQVMHSGGAIVFEDISLKDAETLSLFVDFGANGDIRDHANWCDPVLIRAAERP